MVHRASSAGRLAAWRQSVEQVFGRVIPEVVPAVWQRRRSRPPRFHILLAVALLALIAGCSGTAAPSPSPVTHTIWGTFTLQQARDTVVASTPTGCAGVGGYSDVADGAQVTLKDQSGTVLGIGALDSQPLTKPSTSCLFVFKLENVPDTASFYTVTVDKRGEITKSHAELDASKWTFALTLGS